MKSIDLIREAHHRPKLHDAFGVEVMTKRAVDLLGDWPHERGGLGVTNDCSLFIGEDIVGNRIVREMAHLLVCDACAPTEHNVSGNSIVAIVDGRCSQICQLPLSRCDVSVRAIEQLHVTAQQTGMVREGSDNV